jgi:prevent-host-death family protein
MQTPTSKDAKYGFGRLINLAHARPAAVANHGRPVVVVMAIEEFERLRALEGVMRPASRAKIVKRA